MRNDENLEKIIQDRKNDMIATYSRMLLESIDQKIERHYEDDSNDGNLLFQIFGS